MDTKTLFELANRPINQLADDYAYYNKEYGETTDRGSGNADVDISNIGFLATLGLNTSKPKSQKTYSGKNQRAAMIEKLREQGLSEDWVNYYDKLAEKESGWKANAVGKGTNKKGEKIEAYGLFQFLPSTLQGLGISLDDYVNNVDTQVLAAKKFTEQNLKSLDKYRGKGYSDFQISGAAHLGGTGGVMRYLDKGINAADSNGDSMKARFELFK